MAGEGWLLALEATVDLDGDGVGEVAFRGVDAAHILSGTTGHPLLDLLGEGADLTVGTVGDLDGDGTDDLVLEGRGGGIPGNEKIEQPILRVSTRPRLREACAPAGDERPR